MGQKKTEHEKTLAAVGDLRDSAKKVMAATPEDFAPPQKFKANVTAKQQLDRQKPGHRKLLLILIAGLSCASFLLLGFIVILQMIVRLHQPEYNGVSDTVINILTGGVFGQVIAVVGVIAKYVWVDPKE